MAGVAVAAERGGLGFEDTELRLGLPGGGSINGETAKSNGKRGFIETIDLKLKLNTADSKHVGEEAVTFDKLKWPASQKSSGNDPEKPPAPKAQVVGWPPVRSYRKNVMTVQSEKVNKEKDKVEKPGGNGVAVAAFVKVSMDGAPYLRKVDLKMYRSYKELSNALENMFNSLNMGNCGSQGMNGRDFMNESKLMDLLNGSEFVPTYEDKDGDWMLVGDVPWEMFVESCKRLRIMKGSEAIGLAPRAMEKCKSRS